MQGDDFAGLYGRYVQRLLNYMRVRVSDEALAQDLVAASFERAFAKRHQLRDPEAFAAWLFRIARNELNQHYRRRSLHAGHLRLADVKGVPEDVPLPDLQAARQQELREVLEALSTLSEREQEIIRLKFMGGLTNRAIAGVLRLSEGHVAVILYRAIRKLRGILGAEA
jgi:RNA polymerase sigma-70 factor (ECF subfamily)